MSKLPADPASHREIQSRALRSRSESEHGAKRPARPSDRAEPRPGSRDAAPHRRLTPFQTTVLIVQVILLAVIAVAFLRLRQQEAESRVTIHYVIPGRDEIRQTATCGDSVSLLGYAELDGCTFLGWENEAGQLETRTEFPVYGDLTYTARYIPHFETKRHIPYLSTDGKGIFQVSEPISLRDCVISFYTLLDTDLTGSGRFADVPEDDSCFAAAALLKDLGVFQGSSLHPDSSLTRAELIRTLCCFVPESSERFSFQDMDSEHEYYSYFCTAAANGWIPSGKLVRAAPEAEVSRGEFTHIMNRVLGRGRDLHMSSSDVGTILDVPSSHDYYSDIVEAIIPHEYLLLNLTEVWTASEALPLHETGPVFSGVRLHYIGSDGNPIVDGKYGDLEFTHNGEITSGDAELDRQLWEILETLIDPEEMTQEEMLRAVYDYVVTGFTYYRGNVYERGAEGWGVKEALRMLRNHGGNCYCFAALFYELARFVGYDAKLYIGIVLGEQQVYTTDDGGRVYSPEAYTPHGWVEIEFDGEPYIFDTEYEYRSYRSLDMFKAPDRTRRLYGYTV